MELLNGDCLEILKTLPDNSVDSLVTDPPAGISFMGKDWDSSKGGRIGWVSWMTEVMQECLRVMKPGAHGLVWAIPRTSHWTATALEDAGFEVRDVITHLFGQGFPKSLDISKAIDKAAGAEREVIGENPNARPNSQKNYSLDGGSKNFQIEVQPITAPATDAAKQWSGWGTALKPASEHWILVRKPCSEKTVAENVLRWGTGGINIDASRIGENPGYKYRADKNGTSFHGTQGERIKQTADKKGSEFIESTKGRFPANLVLSHSLFCTDDECDEGCAIKALDGQSGTLKSGNLEPHHRLNASDNKSMSGANQTRSPRQSFGGDLGGASRFFYCAKISTSERNAGLQDLPDKTLAMSNAAKAAEKRGETYENANSGINTVQTVKNNHPTVKPQKLMRYLCALITPPKGLVLDPFMGSGSTGLAALSEGFQFVGIEKESEYYEIAQARITRNLE